MQMTFDLIDQHNTSHMPEIGLIGKACIAGHNRLSQLDQRCKTGAELLQLTIFAIDTQLYTARPIDLQFIWIDSTVDSIEYLQSSIDLDFSIIGIFLIWINRLRPRDKPTSHVIGHPKPRHFFMHY